MAERASITPELCRQLLRYEPETGRLFWKPRAEGLFKPSRTRWGGEISAEKRADAWNVRYSGHPALTAINSSGYQHGQVLGAHMSAHQICWMIFYGVAAPLIDHINGEPADNRIVNLRLATPSQNSANQKINVRNTSGQKGVRWSSEKRKWQASITHHRKFHHLGYFESVDDAGLAYRNAAAILHGAFARRVHT